MKNLIKARAIIIKDKKIFLVKDSEYWKYMIPWGTWEQWETIKEILYREIKEELWITPIIDKLVWFREYLNKEWDITLQFLFLIKNVSDFVNIDKEKCSHHFEWTESWFYSLEELKENNAYIPDDLEEIYNAAIWWYEYNTLI